MNTSSTPPVDGAGFRPPSCPNPRCLHHHERAGWRWVLSGSYRRQAPPHRVQRFRCRRCHRAFSVQTFRTTYWLKHPELQPAILRQLGACSSYRQVADVLGCAHSTVLNQARRLGRHCLLFQHHRAPPGPPDEPLVLDGLRADAYGASYRFSVDEETWDHEPEPSKHNPDGLPEVTIERATVKEYGPTAFGADPLASASVRSATDRIVTVQGVADIRQGIDDVHDEARAATPAADERAVHLRRLHLKETNE